jgi:CheY-like chemotaxis protein
LNRDCANHYKGTVLVVEDEALILLELRKMLAELGWKVTFLASDLEEAQRLVSKGTFDLGILDMNLKGRSSSTVAEILKTRQIPVVVASPRGRRKRIQPRHHQRCLSRSGVPSKTLFRRRPGRCHRTCDA